MAQQLARHGSEAGYNSELKTGNICDRCRAAHRVWSRRKSTKGKAEGLGQFSSKDVIDHLDLRAHASNRPRVQAAPPRRDATRTAKAAPADPAHTDAMPQAGPETQPQSQAGPKLGERLSASLRNLVVPGNNDYVNEDGSPDYLHPIDPDPEPSDDGGGQWAGVGDEEFVINKAGMALIEDNLGTYLSVIGITMDMIDPYCGPILAENFDNIVGRWTKVIARYPRAASLFMSKDGGTLMTWIGALQATWPVLYAVYEHHLSKKIQTDREGRVYRVDMPQNANGHNVDATMPPMPGYNYTVDLCVIAMPKGLHAGAGLACLTITYLSYEQSNRRRNGKDRNRRVRAYRPKGNANPGKASIILW